ncbi:acyl-CoA N-acyltransferase [Truncatella angustata]|uniref:Acyl-CoA N-acyltransferase n=1 Tax=Truncatella angustata TaxID=152316 RepID=A0A9P8RIJ6_9PEZI|nr:acyl-CoA N-acyltransferase [Truncatella angustata]KAH6646683.1 acyl-CoA N-acyltransferase [Truncatella angustata]
MPQSTYTISKSSRRDVARLGQIAASTWDKDKNTQVKLMGTKPGAFAEGMAMGIQHYTDSTSSVVIKATDDRDGKIVGFCAWGFRNSAFDGQIVKDETTIPGAERIKELEAMTGKHLNDFFEKRLRDGSKSIFVGMTAVDPGYKGVGVGSQLMSWGTEHADRLGASMWVHASEAGWPLFEKHGFKEVDRLTIDLDEWAVGPPPKDGAFGDSEKWGQYTFRYGGRQPASA